MSFSNWYKYREGLVTQVSDRANAAAPSIGSAVGNFAADVGADMVPGGSFLKAGGKLLWDILSNRRQQTNLQQVLDRVSQHEQSIRQAGLDPADVFHIDDEIAASLSDQAINSIMEQTLGYLDQYATKKYQGMPTGMAEKVAYNFCKKLIRPIKEKQTPQLSNRIRAASQAAEKEGRPVLTPLPTKPILRPIPPPPQ